MIARILLSTTTIVLVLSQLTAAAAEDAIAPIKAVKKAMPTEDAFNDAGRGKPLVIRSGEDAAKYFDGKNLAALKESVNFESQTVLVFAWRGSGQDELTFAVGESHPEHIFFSIKPGRTRDLRPHVHVFALRSNVKWSVK